MFCDREDAGRQLVAKLKARRFRDPLVLAIPRGGIVIGAVLAQELGADLDVVLARKLRAPYQPELAFGAIAETGAVYLNQHAEEFIESLKEYLEEERRWQERANCLGVDPELFFPERGASTREAKSVCAGCAVRLECLEYALRNHEKFGIWRGLSERERRRLRRRRALGEIGAINASA